MDPPNEAAELTPYVVYLDESFFQFWPFDNRSGNFCYAVFGLPQSQLIALGEFHDEFLHRFQAAIEAELKEDPPVELKSHLFRRLPFNTRRRLGLQLREFMTRANAFLLADFTEVRGFVLEGIRSSLARHAHKRLPDDWETLYERRRRELTELVKKGKEGIGPVLDRLMGTTIGAVAHFLTTRASSYEVFFDPRQPREDLEVADSIREFTEMVLNRMHQEEPGRFKGVSGRYKSGELPGLQVADLLVGEVRNWFLNNEAILRFESGPDLVTEENANAHWYFPAGIKFMSKRQRVRKLPPGLVRRLQRANESSILPFFRNHLARSLLSCVAYWGEFRHVNFEEGSAIDSLDDWVAALVV